MFRNHFTSIFRNLKRNKGYTFINISGLAIGFAASLVIGIYVSGEFTYDRHFKDYEKIYRLSSKNFAFSSLAHLEQIKANIPEVQAFVNLTPNPSTTLKTEGNKSFLDEDVFYSTEDYFKVFDVDLLYGSKENALSAPDALVLTASMAERMFGDRNPVGEQVHINTQASQDMYRVTAVVKDLPENTHLRYSAIAMLPKSYAVQMVDNYNYTTGYSYFKTIRNSPVEVLSEKVERTFLPIMHRVWRSDKSLDEFAKDFESGLWILPLEDVHLKSNIQFEASEPGNEKYLYIFIAIAIFIILLAAINYVNLSTAQASKRAKEIGVRKVLGSERKQLVLRFLSESILVSFVAMLFGLGLAEATLKLMSGAGFELFSSNIFQHSNLIMLMGGIALFTGAVAGIYPAFYLTKFRPTSVLKGDYQAKDGSKLFRNGLVIFQFTVSIALAVFALFVSQQLKYSLSKDLGFEKDNIIVVDNSKSQLGADDENVEPFRNELLNNPAITNVAFSHFSMINQLPLTGMIEKSPEAEFMRIQYKYVDHSFLPTMDFELVQGRFFDEELDDFNKVMVVNESLANQMGGDVIGRRFDANFNGRDVEIIGVVKDFHYQDFTSEIGPVAFFYSALRYQVNIRFETNDLSRTLDQIEQVYGSFSSDPFDYYFFDQKFNRLFKMEERLGQTITLFTGLSVFVAILGLVGLVSYRLDQRIKEIGIRKVLGASVKQILAMLSKEMLWLVGVAFLVALPLAYYAVSGWMNDFAYHVDITASPFLLVGITAIVTIVSVVALRSLKTASANPVKALRNE